jgi:hypothetical protein
MVARARRSGARSREGRGLAGGRGCGRGLARGGRGRAGQPGDGWGGRLPGAVRKDVATALRCPSAPETARRWRPQPLCLRRPRPRSGLCFPLPSPPLPSQVRAGQASAAGEEAAVRRWGLRGTRLGVGSGRRTRSGGVVPGCGLGVPPVWGARPGMLLVLQGRGKPLPRGKCPLSGQPTPVPLKVLSKKAFHLWGRQPDSPDYPPSALQPGSSRGL